MSEYVNRYVIGDCRETLRAIPDATFHCCVTSPPYWGLRDYGHPGQLGLEPTPGEYVARMVEVFAEVKRTLRDDGTLWLNIGDSYTNTKNIPPGLKQKDLVGVPWSVAKALQADGWYLRSDIIWHKPKMMPEPVTDRPTKAHEYIFLMAKNERYFFDAGAIQEALAPASADRYKYTFGGAKNEALVEANKTGVGRQTSVIGERTAPTGRNSRTVWTIPSEAYAGAHFATMPTALVTKCILAGCPSGGIVLDPFMGSGTVGQVAEQLGRKWFGCELNEEYAKQIKKRTAQMGLF